MAAAVQGGSKSAATSIGSPALEGKSNTGQEKSKSRKEELLQNPDQKDKVCVHRVKFVACNKVMVRIREKRAGFISLHKYKTRTQFCLRYPETKTNLQQKKIII